MSKPAPAPLGGCGAPGHLGATAAEGTSYCVTCEAAARAYVRNHCASCGAPFRPDHTVYQLDGPLGKLYAHEHCLERVEP